MDNTLAMVIAALRTEMHEHLNGLGDFPKKDAFDHGVQVGTYHGLKQSLDVIDRVLNDIAEEDKRR